MTYVDPRGNLPPELIKRIDHLEKRVEQLERKQTLEEQRGQKAIAYETTWAYPGTLDSATVNTSSPPIYVPFPCTLYEVQLSVITPPTLYLRVDLKVNGERQDMSLYDGTATETYMELDADTYSQRFRPYSTSRNDSALFCTPNNTAITLVIRSAGNNDAAGLSAVLRFR